MTPVQGDGIALFYLARGADADHLASIRRFVKAYGDRAAGVPHELVVIFKGFASGDALDEARAAIAGAAFQEVHTGDETFDLGAYAEAILRVSCERAAFLNTGSEPIASGWLGKLNAALGLPGMGLVGASGSFQVGLPGGAFPNIHVRTNAFMMRTPLALRTLGRLTIRNKLDAYHAEHGPDSLTRQVVSSGLTVAVVGANGRAYAPEWWRGSRTFRQGDQANLLVADNQTRAWDAMTWPERQFLYEGTWGTVRTLGQWFGSPRS
jgi:hypothetical protein